MKKIIISKDKKGKATNYQLNLNSCYFDLINSNNNKIKKFLIF